jgi:hypothetical protein
MIGPVTGAEVEEEMQTCLAEDVEERSAETGHDAYDDPVQHVDAHRPEVESGGDAEHFTLEPVHDPLHFN